MFCNILTSITIDNLHWIATIPAILLSFISVAYILQAPVEGFGLDATFSSIVGIVIAGILFMLFMVLMPKKEEPYS